MYSFSSPTNPQVNVPCFTTTLLPPLPGPVAHCQNPSLIPRPLGARRRLFIALRLFLNPQAQDSDHAGNWREIVLSNGKAWAPCFPCALRTAQGMGKCVYLEVTALYENFTINAFHIACSASTLNEIQNLYFHTSDVPFCRVRFPSAHFLNFCIGNFFEYSICCPSNSEGMCFDSHSCWVCLVYG